MSNNNNKLINQKFTLIDFVLKEWLLLTSGIGFLLSSIYAKEIPHISEEELQVLLILFTLFCVVNGLLRSGIFSRIGEHIERGKFLPLKLILATFFLSMIVTNDVSLVIIVPLTLSLNIDRKDIIVILEAIAANGGSALTPFGNPQNLYIYWFYKISPIQFISEIVPLSILTLLSIILLSFLVNSKKEIKHKNESIKISKFALPYLLFLLMAILTIFHILPIYINIFLITFILIFDRKTLLVDYSLLATFLFFFGISENFIKIFGQEIINLKHPFLISALMSQLISNVPAALLLAKFTKNWEALLWGVNVGGFGSLFGSLANLIAFKFYISQKDIKNQHIFTFKFVILGYIFFFSSIFIYFILYK